MSKLCTNQNTNSKLQYNKPQSMILRNVQSDQIPYTPSEINSDKRKNIFS
jgi:hypothetical protein